MKDNFDMKKFLAENKLGAYARLKEENNKESEANVLREWDPEDSDIIIPNKSRSDKNFFNKIVVPLLNKMLNTGKEPGPDVFGKYKPSGKRANWYYEDYGDKILINVNKDLDIDTDTLQAKIDKLYSQHVKSNPVKETEDLANADEISMEEEVDEAISLKPKKYYQILDQGTNEWHDEYQYIGKVDYGSTVGEEGEHMFILPTSPGNFIFNSVPETDLDILVKPSMDESKEIEEQFNFTNEADDIFNGEYSVSDAHYNRMDKLVNDRDYTQFITAATNIMRSLDEKGFETKDIFYYLYTRLTADI